MPLVVVAAIAAGGAVAAGVVAASTVLYAGIAVSVVGKVTKSKELTQIGSGMSLGAGIASAASSIFGAAEGAGAGAGIGAGAGAENIVPMPTGIDTAAGSLGEAATGGLADAATTAGVGDVAATTGGEALASEASTGGGLLNPSATADSLVATPGAAPAAANGMSADNLALGGADGLGGTGVLAPPPPGGIQGWWSKLTDTTKAKLLSGAADGLMKGWDANQRNEFEREKLNLDKQRYDTSMANASAQPVVAFKQYAPAKTGGLLNPTTKG